MHIYIYILIKQSCNIAAALLMVSPQKHRGSSWLGLPQTVAADGKYAETQVGLLYYATHLYIYKSTSCFR